MTTSSNNESSSSTHIPVEKMMDNICPKCGSDEITGGFVETGDGVAIQKLSCNVCNAIWRNIYDLSAVELVEDNVVIEIRK